MNAIQLLEDALVLAEDMDQRQQHEAAAVVLDSAIHASNGDWNGESEEDLLKYAGLVQECTRERERQLRRYALLNSYLA